MQQKEDIIKKLRKGLDELKEKVENEVNLCMDERRAEEKRLVESLRDELKEFRLESLDNKEEFSEKFFAFLGKQREKTFEFYNKKQINSLNLISKNKKEMVDLLKTIKDENPDFMWEDVSKEKVIDFHTFYSEETSRFFKSINSDMLRTLETLDKEVEVCFGTVLMMNDFK